MFWTIGYDTIYAHQDKEDDALIGVKSTALKFGENTQTWLYLFYGLTIVLLTVAGAFAAIGWAFYLILGLGAIHLGHQIASLDIHLPQVCLRLFPLQPRFWAVDPGRNHLWKLDRLSPFNLLVTLPLNFVSTPIVINFLY